MAFLNYLLETIKNLPHFKGKYRLLRTFKKEFISNAENIKVTTHSGVNDSLKPGKTFIDIGANVGIITAEIAKKRLDVDIYSVEASPFIYGYLAKNIESNKFTNVKFFQYGIHEKSGEKLPFYSPKDKTGCGSFSPVFTNENTMVECISLDDFVTNNKIPR